MLDSFKKLYQLLEPRGRRRGGVLLGMILILGFMEMAGVGSIMPFVAVLTNSKIVATNRYLSMAYDWIGFSTPEKFLFFLGILVLILTVGSTVFKAITTWTTVRFTRQEKFALSLRLFEHYLQQPYEWFLGKHTSDLGKSVLSEVDNVIGGGLTPAMRLITQGVIAGFVVGLLVVVEPLLAVTVTVFVGTIYGLIMWGTRRYVSRIGKERLRANRERFRISAEALGGIKEIKVLGLESTFLRRFKDPSRRLVRHAAASQTVAQIPQYALQVVAISTIMVIVLYQLRMQGALERVLPVVALYVLAGQRLLPAFQQIYACITSLGFNKPPLDLLHHDLMEKEKVQRQPQSALQTRLPQLKHRVELREIAYFYPTAASPALKNVSVTIPARATVGFVGKTGAGKTTTVDVILGLLEPKSGEMLVDDIPISNANRRAWQNCLGYVPQQIFLADDTVAANIAFGVGREQIDMNMVERAARIANLHQFVTEDLKDGYQTEIGERGVRLSGGQRQRIGIARALYRNPDVIIMDEATSALDNVTERAVMDAVHNLANKKTIILIAHRLTTVQRCDLIFVFDKGRVVASGTYDQLAATNDRFQAMLKSVSDQLMGDKAETDSTVQTAL